MLLTKLKELKQQGAWLALGLLVNLLCLAPAFAKDSSSSATVSMISAEGMLQNIANQMPYAMRMITALAYVMGMYFIIYGIMKLKHFGEARAMGGQEHSLTGPILYLVVGSLLLYLPTTVQVGMSTFWGNPSPISYTSNSDQWHQFLNDCFLVVEVFGTIAFIRGLVMLTSLGGHGGQPGTLSRAMTHIIGGLMCINVYQFLQMVLNTLGVSF